LDTTGLHAIETHFQKLEELFEKALEEILLLETLINS
jgi:hypothetical protein